MNLARISFLALACLLPVAASPCFAQPKSAASAPTDPKPILAACAEAVANMRALSYSFTSSETGGEPNAAKYKGVVSAARADAGGWKLYASGDIETDTKTAFEIAYDGASARAIKPADKVVVERSLENVEELTVFFSGQNARHPVAWELLAEKPLAFDHTKAVHEGEATIDGAPCDKVLVPLEADPAAATAQTAVRFFISRSDHLPRRIERIRTVKGDKGETQTVRTVEMTALKTDADAEMHAFSLSTPDGYRVRADTSAKPNRLVKRGGNTGREESPERDSGLLAVGSEAPDWALKDGDGNEVKLSGLRGKVVVMDFWATWCPPCVAAMPHVQALHEKYADKGVKVYGANTFERSDAKKYMTDKKYTYGLLLKADKVATQYKVTGIPTFYVIDKTGKIVFAAVGMPDESRLEKVIEDAIAK
ncbi:MAG: TlpA family protein disulfide reductase [Phycisphaerales bacterium]